MNGDRCRQYVAQRVRQPWKSSKPQRTGRPARLVTGGAARRELEDLRSAINHHREEGLCSEIVSVALPEKAAGRETWLTRSEAAKLIRAARRAKQVKRDKITQREVGKHIARFVRRAANRRVSGVLAGCFTDARKARARQKSGTHVRLPDRLLAHLRRWHRLGISTRAVVEWNGKPVAPSERASPQPLSLRASTSMSRPIRRGTPPPLGRCRTALTFGRPLASLG